MSAGNPLALIGLTSLCWFLILLGLVTIVRFTNEAERMSNPVTGVSLILVGGLNLLVLVTGGIEVAVGR